MTTTAEKIAVMQAFAEGKALVMTYFHMGEKKERISKDTHGDTYDFDFANNMYEIKPQPKAIYVNEYGENEQPMAHEDEDRARKCAASHVIGVAAPYIELTPELEKLAKENKII